MFLEHKGELARGYTFFRGAFDLGDIDHDGIDEMVIADDEGGFQVYRYTSDGFIPVWINDPITITGYIVAVKILHDHLPGVRPRILLLDSDGTLHQWQYNGYLYEEIDVFENYSNEGDSGRLMITGILGEDSNSSSRTILIAIPETDASNPVDKTIGNPGGTSRNRNSGQPSGFGTGDQGDMGPFLLGTEPQSQWEGMTIYKLTSAGFVELTDAEMAGLEEGDIFFIEDLTENDLDELIAVSADHDLAFHPGRSRSGLVGITDLDSDMLVELLMSVSDPTRPVDRLEIYTEEGGDFVVKITLELPLLNEMVLGDIDGDDFTEIVGLTFDGEVLVYQYDPLLIKTSRGRTIEWDLPHRRIDGDIWVSSGGFVNLGCNVVASGENIEIRKGNLVVTIDRDEDTIRCGDREIVSGIPVTNEGDPIFIPLKATLECLNFRFTVESGGNTYVVVTGQ